MILFSATVLSLWLLSSIRVKSEQPQPITLIYPPSYGHIALTEPLPVYRGGSEMEIRFKVNQIMQSNDKSVDIAFCRTNGEWSCMHVGKDLKNILLKGEREVWTIRWLVPWDLDGLQWTVKNYDRVHDFNLEIRVKSRDMLGSLQPGKLVARSIKMEFELRK